MGPEKRKKGELLAYVLEHAATKTYVQMAEELELSPATVAGVLSRLRKSGRLPRTVRTKYVASQAPVGLERALSAFKDQDLRDESTRLALLTALVPYAPDAVKLGIVKFIDEAMRSRGQGVGPPPPTDELEQTNRLVRLLQAAGRRVAEQALLIAFAETPNAQPTSLEGANPPAEAPLPVQAPEPNSLLHSHPRGSQG